MKYRIPLYAKVLLLLLLNLVLLATVFYGLVKARLPLGLDTVFLAQADGRIQAASRVLTGELDEKSPEQWGDVLKRYSTNYHVQFFLYRGDGSPAAGDALTLPREIGSKLRLAGAQPGPRGFAGGGFGRGQPGRGGGGFGGGGFFQREGGPGGRAGGPPEAGPGPAGLFQPAQPPPPPGDLAGFPVSTGNPARYWFAAVTSFRVERQPGPRPFIIMAVTDSLFGSGLLFDLTNWLWIGFGMVVLSILFWLPFARGLTHAISQVSHATQQIAAGRFDARVETRRRDELGQLAEAVNSMAGRLSGLLKGQKRFLGDIAHELCSPIARLQLSLGILEQNADEKQREQLQDLREEVELMSKLVNELLSFSKASLEPAAVKFESVKVRDVVEEILRRERRDDAIVVVEIDDTVRVLADPRLLSRALGNLLRNAYRYAAHAGPITVSARRIAMDVTITVADSGPGVPESALPQLFDPFYRPELSRDRSSGGVGLGLAIVKTCIESCNGTVSCCNRQPSGFEVTLRLPQG